MSPPSRKRDDTNVAIDNFDQVKSEKSFSDDDDDYEEDLSPDAKSKTKLVSLTSFSHL